jgi:transposase
MSAPDSTAGLPPEVLAYIRELEASNRDLKARVEQLEELFRRIRQRIPC